MGRAAGRAARAFAAERGAAAQSRCVGGVMPVDALEPIILMNTGLFVPASLQCVVRSVTRNCGARRASAAGHMGLCAQKTVRAVLSSRNNTQIHSHIELH